MEGVPAKEARSEDTKDKKDDRKIGRTERASDFRLMPRGVMDKLMNNSEVSRATERDRKLFEFARKAENTDKEEEDSETDDDDTSDADQSGKPAKKFNTKESQKDTTNYEDVAFKDKNSVKAILSAVEQEILPEVSTQQNENMRDLDGLEAETIASDIPSFEHFDDETSIDQSEAARTEPESIQQIIQRNFSNRLTGNAHEQDENLSGDTVEQDADDEVTGWVGTQTGTTPLGSNAPGRNQLQNGPNQPLSPHNNGPAYPPQGPPVPPFGPQNPNNTGASGNIPVINNYNTIVNPTEYHHTAPTAALLAVDYLSHRANRKRTEKLAKNTARTFDRMNETQKADSYGFESAIKKLEKQQSNNELLKNGNVIGDTEKKDTKKQEVIYNRIQNLSSDRHQNIEQINNGHVNTAELPASSIERKPAATFENTLESMAQAEKGSIQSEFLYERRHEVKDTPGDDQSVNSAIAPYEMDTAMLRMKHNGQSLVEITNKADLLATKKVDSQEIYKQAAITGFWGAAVGIVLFVIFYMISR